MRKLILIILLYVLFVSCVSQSKYEKLEAREEYARETAKEYIHLYDSLIYVVIPKLEEKIKQQNKSRRRTKTKSKFYTEQQALNFVKDWYGFYNAEWIYRNPRIRRSANNVFVVSLEEATKSTGRRTIKINKDLTTTETGEMIYTWYSNVYELTIANNGKYNFKPKF
ncbi:hypothetical protein ATE84_1619 [Aquimarina sp. MAR_2010_214]|uniref:hypothetical protein n=1 Tax=Aquimarina sp. MAR_2010_214 TaxID=1250026 RepID=UPI000C70DB95|nr:hypothetical protein [Aquimarina sp. MAR_2010_214]PKV49588.1 hypothetical protein ATE84_1619 [Aquimarina sp. MAR_2010_214]